MKIVLDTNAYSALQRGEAAGLKTAVEAADQIMLPFVVVAELKAGFGKGNQTAANQQKLYMFLGMDAVSVMWPDDDTLQLYAKLWAELSGKGKPIPTNDVWIAALCLQNSLPLATADSDFDHIPLLERVAVI